MIGLNEFICVGFMNWVVWLCSLAYGFTFEELKYKSFHFVVRLVVWLALREQL